MTEGTLPRISFDSNLGSREGGFPLIYTRSREELAAIEGGPQEGMMVEIYMTDELQSTAILKRGTLFGDEVWLGIPVEPLRSLY